MNKTIRYSVFATAFAVVLAACSKSTHAPFQITGNEPAIFSTRPQIATHGLVLIKLSEKPVLSSLVTENDQKKIDPKRVEAVAAEQEKVLKELAAISPDIKLLFRYRMILNGIAVAAPLNVLEKIKALTNVVYTEGNGTFTRAVLPASAVAKAVNSGIAAANSVKFIGGEEAHKRGVRGQGMRVGIIDTGIDYTHAMFGGEGTEEAFKKVDPNLPWPAFPNAKVIGGYDFAGTDYDSASGNFMNRIPKPDVNPMDEGGHGTHVAGTVAGRGDGVNSYDGVAPDALLYAIKVFGKDGSTGDATVIAALEYSVDPNTDADISDQLDVVNMSLGGGYGDPHILYTEAIQNLARAGTVVVASAGNSGDTPYIVGAPSIADEAISVAASVDNMDHNWRFRAVMFSTPSEPEIYVEAIEGTIGKKIEEAGDVKGPLVYAGLADKDFSEELKAQLKGKVALIDRGIVPFAEKVRRAFEAGAIGVVVANNQPGEPLAMGGDGEWAIPAIMVNQELGAKLKAEMEKGPVTIDFLTERRIEKPELIDSITGFSSKGPRSFDALIKPEIAAPGAQVISAKMGGGREVVPMSGTSMAGPHMAGVMALLKQTHPTLTSAELKSMAMGTAKTLIDPKTKAPYPISRQGAGRVQVIPALDARVVSLPTSISLGEVPIEINKSFARTLEFRSISGEALKLAVVFESSTGLRMTGPATVELAPEEKVELNLRFTVDARSINTASGELDGMIKLMDGEKEVLRVPVMAILNKISRVKAQELVVHSTSSFDAQGAIAELTVKNDGVNAGEAYPFNLIATDARKENPTRDIFRSQSCDMAAAGYRVIKRGGVSILQFAVKLHEPVTAWDQCEISVLIDSNGDGTAEQELLGIKQEHLKGLTSQAYSSVLIDAAKTRELRKQFELDTIAKKPEIKEDYTEAVLDISPIALFEHSTVAIVEAPIEKLAVRPSGELSVRIATSYQEMSNVEPDDFLAAGAWTPVSVAAEGAAYVGMPEKIALAPGESKSVTFAHGAGNEALWLLYPYNKPVIGGIIADAQSEVVVPSFRVEMK